MRTYFRIGGQDVLGGPDGGREVELGTSATHVQWRYVGDDSWTDLVALEELQGADGVGLEFTWDGTSLGVRREGEAEYTFVDLEGPQGPEGPQGEKGDPGDSAESNTKLVSFDVGNDVDTDFLFTHGIGTRDLVHSIRENGEPYRVVDADVAYPTLNDISVGFASPPTQDQYRLTVMGEMAPPPSLPFPEPLIRAVVADGDGVDGEGLQQLTLRNGPDTPLEQDGTSYEVPWYAAEGIGGQPTIWGSADPSNNNVQGRLRANWPEGLTVDSLTMAAVIDGEYESGSWGMASFMLGWWYSLNWDGVSLEVYGPDSQYVSLSWAPQPSLLVARINPDASVNIWLNNELLTHDQDTAGPNPSETFEHIILSTPQQSAEALAWGTALSDEDVDGIWQYASQAYSLESPA